MTLTASIVDRIRSRIHDAPMETERLLEDAADRIEELEAGLQFIADGYDNQDVNHVDYRVKVYQVALDLLEPKATP